MPAAGGQGRQLILGVDCRTLALSHSNRNPSSLGSANFGRVKTTGYNALSPTGLLKGRALVFTFILTHVPFIKNDLRTFVPAWARMGNLRKTM